VGVQEDQEPLKDSQPGGDDQAAAEEFAVAGRWSGSIGAVAGLLAGLVITQALAVSCLRLFSRNLAEMTWEIGSPILALLGALGGYLLFVRCCGRNWTLALLLALLLLAAAAAAAAGLGFPWMSETQVR